MVVVNKIKQITEYKLPQVVALARAELEDKSDTAVAKWIIAHSPYWRSEGYNRIIEEMGKLIEGETTDARS